MIRPWYNQFSWEIKAKRKQMCCCNNMKTSGFIYFFEWVKCKWIFLNYKYDYVTLITEFSVMRLIIKSHTFQELTDEVEVKYKIYQCLMATKQCREAMVVVSTQNIPYPLNCLHVHCMNRHIRGMLPCFLIFLNFILCRICIGLSYGCHDRC